MKAVVTVIGHDTLGIISKVSAACAEAGANIIDITQSVLREYFAMIMLVDLSRMNKPFSVFVDELHELGAQNGLEIHTMHEDIFDAMHKI